MDKKNILTVIARRWSGGWELIIDEDNATSTRSLARAKDQIRDYLETLNPENDYSATEINLVYDIDDDLAQSINDTQKVLQTAAEAREYATTRTRRLAHQLHARGFSLADTGALIGVSKTRAAQLLNDA